jgi:hypothetical protein
MDKAEKRNFSCSSRDINFSSPQQHMKHHLRGGERRETADCSSCGLSIARVREGIHYSRSMAKVYCARESKFDL